MKYYSIYFKSLIDFTLALIIFVILSPLFVIITIGLYFVNNGKPFFFQMRPGKNGKIFRIIKFKTMNDKKDEKGNLLQDSERLTDIGIFVRKTSLDEIPQLINVIKGEMSLIGPRPLLSEYLPLYSEIQNRRHEIKPGITGWAQVNGRNAISWDEKFNYDVFYVDHISFFLDLKIVLYTFQKIVVTSEVSADQHATMPRFDKREN